MEEVKEGQKNPEGKVAEEEPVRFINVKVLIAGDIKNINEA